MMNIQFCVSTSRTISPDKQATILLVLNCVDNECALMTNVSSNVVTFTRDIHALFFLLCIRSHTCAAELALLS